MAKITLERSSGANSRSLGPSQGKGGGGRSGMNSELVTIGGSGGSAAKRAAANKASRNRADSGARDLEAGASTKHPYAVDMNDSDFFDSGSDDHRSPTAREIDEYPLRRQDV